MSDGKANFVEALVQDPNNPPKVRLIVGYEGKASGEGMTRIYANAELSSHIDVPAEAVLHSQPVPDDALGAKYFWVQRDADVTRRDTNQVEVRAKFLSGQITAQAADAAPAGPAAAAAPVGQVSLIIECPTPTFNPNNCPSNIGVCPSIDICASNVCITQQPQFCPNTLIPAVCPTRADGDCFTRLIAQCRTWNTPCLSQVVLCQSRPINCITIGQPCPPRSQLVACPPRTILTPGCGNVSIQLCPSQGICPSAVDACPSALICNTIEFTFNPLM